MRFSMLIVPSRCICVIVNVFAIELMLVRAAVGYLLEQGPSKSSLFFVLSSRGNPHFLQPASGLA